MSAVDEQLYNTVINHTQRLEAMDVTIKELAERVEALEGKKPAPDLEAQITKTIEDIKYLFLLPPDIDIPATEGHLRQLLRAFAAELGVE